jgi:methylenetetrahydrofolate reductase (NADPH)
MPQSRDRDMALQGSRFEIIPIRSVDAQLDALPKAATVTVTASPRFGITRTIEYVELLAGRGFNVVPHLSARQVVDHRQLTEIVARFQHLGVTDVFVIGGDDRRPAGSFDCAYDLVEAMSEIGHEFHRVGVACYPEGHPLIDDDTLMADLLRKEPFADYLVSQICFDVAATAAWVHRIRAAGVKLPIYVGVPGVVRRARLLELSFRLGVGTSLRFLSKQRALGGRLFQRSMFRPNELLEDVGDMLADLELGVVGYHFFTFNEIAQTVRWIRRQHDPEARSEGAQ